MPNSSHLRLGLCLLSLALAAPLAAQPTGDVEGVYQDQVFEVGSTLVLSPSGRFLWVFSYGALDMAGEGLWTREADGTILLNSDPPVSEPRFELVGRSRDDRPGVAVRLACDSREAAQFSDVLFEYADGERVADRFDGLEVRTPAEAPRAVAAIQIGSEAFNLLSERFPVDAAEANVFTFRFIPNDLGRADFRAQRVNVDNNGLAFTWRGMDLRYTRESSAAGEELPRLPPVPASGGDAPPVALELSLGEPFDALAARAANALTPVPDEGVLVARGPIDLRLNYGEQSIDLGRVEGGRHRLVVVQSRGDGYVDGLTFAHQADLLSLTEALARARALQAWLGQAGFAVLPGADRLDPAPFTTMPSDGSEGVSAAGWDEAAALLADDGRGVTAMELYALRTGDQLAMVRLENVRRHEREVCAHSDWQGEPGREWRLLVTISPSLAPVAEE